METMGSEVSSLSARSNIGTVYTDPCLTQVHRQATNHFREHFTQPVLAEPVQAHLIKDNDVDEFGRWRGGPM